MLRIFSILIASCRTFQIRLDNRCNLLGTSKFPEHRSFILSSCIIEITIIKIKGILPLCLGNISKQLLQLLHKLRPVHHPIPPSNIPLILDA